MKVLKFGGTSLKDTACQRQVIDIVRAEGGQDCVVIVSALGGVTDELIELSDQAARGDLVCQGGLQRLMAFHRQQAQALLSDTTAMDVFVDEVERKLSDLLQGVALLKECSSKIAAMIQSHGEQLSAFLLSQVLKAMYINACDVIVTDDYFLHARVNFDKTNQLLQKQFTYEAGLSVMTGYIAATENGDTTLLGRSGSDYTAAIVGAALDAEVVVIWTDVDGVMTADPRRVPNAKVLKAISYAEAMEMSHFGATVIHPATMTPLIQKGIPIQIRNTLQPQLMGTLVCAEAHEKRIICGLSSQDNIALLTIQGPGMQGVTGIASRLFSALAQAGINIILISQASSEQSICFVVLRDDAKRAQSVANAAFALELDARYVVPVVIDYDVSIVAVVGDNMKQHVGIAGGLFDALAKVQVNIIAIAQGASELNVSIVIKAEDETVALCALHETFFEAKETLQLFLLGATGLVGGTLLRQLSDFQHDWIALQLYGLANSQHQFVTDTPTPFDDGLNILEQAPDIGLATFVAHICQRNHLSNRVFIDCSASDEIADYYPQLLTAGVAVVTPNKRASSGTMARYCDIHAASLITRTPYHYEVTVGAALPVIQTVKTLIETGDKLHRIEAVLSGSLNYIFTQLSADNRFSEVVKDARDKGFTEPDPRDDLSGMDVARKLLILLREWGSQKELSDLVIQTLIPERLLDLPVDEFLTALTTEDETYNKRVNATAMQGEVLRYVAVFDGEQAEVGLKAYPESHSFYRLDGSNNMLILTTDRYADNPLIIEGPGAGAAVTAAGVLADTLSLARGRR